MSSGTLFLQLDDMMHFIKTYLQQFTLISYAKARH